MRCVALSLSLALAACGPSAEPTDNPVVTGVDNATSLNSNGTADIPQPESDKGAADNSTTFIDNSASVTDAPDLAQTRQAATQVVARYYALIEAGSYRQAYDVWESGRAGMTAAQFVRSFDRYAEYHVRIGVPGDIDSAAGSHFITVPVQPYGRLKQGGSFNMRGEIILRRLNEGLGATPEQLAWHIYESNIKPRPGESTPAPMPRATDEDQPVARYRCDGGVRLTALFNAETNSATVLRAGNRLGVLQRRGAGSGIWYRGGGHELRGTTTAITFTERGKPPLSCKSELP